MLCTRLLHTAGFFLFSFVFFRVGRRHHHQNSGTILLACFILFRSWHGLGFGVFGRFDLAALGGCHTLNVCYVMFTTSAVQVMCATCAPYMCTNGAIHTIITNYQLPNGPVKAGRRWGQRHPQGANLGSNGILKFLSKTDTMAATSPP